MLKYLIILLFPIRLLAQQTFESPNHKIKFNLKDAKGNLQYSVSFNNHMVIENSPLGIVVNDKLYGENLAVGNILKYKKNETYAYRGVHSKATNRYNGYKVSLSSKTAPFVLHVKVFNDGVAFSYSIEGKGNFIVKQENTQFTLPSESIIWLQSNVKYYEGLYQKKIIETLVKGSLIGPPATIELPKQHGFLAITEGGLTDFAGMSLMSKGNRKLQSNLSGTTTKEGSFETPWRIIEIGKDLNTLVNCDIIANVSPAFDKQLFPNGYATDWIKPGRSVWSWLAGKGPVTLNNMKKFTDMASELGFEYNLIDEGWGSWKDTVNKRDYWDQMKELVDYSKDKGVKIWVWKAYPDRNGIPGIKDPQRRRKFFAKCKELGIAGLKVDFFDSENQEIIDFYQAALKDAAECQLMLNFHGANKPTGESRSWPNEMTREAVRGLENRPPWAQTNTIIPFTRYLSGHADYTPIHFGDRMGEVTWAHHVASMAIFTSPLLCVGADPQSLLDNPAKEMIKSIPPTWDETIVLPESKIGDLVVFARRSGDRWFLAALNGVHKPRTVNLDLSFLSKGKYAFSIMKDNSEKQAIAIFKNANVTGKSKITVAMNAEGGFIGRLEKVK